MLRDQKIWVGTGVNGPAYLLPGMANRHGLIAGATGTGKTVTLKVLAEGFSEMGVPVFLSDIKSDLSGMVKPGIRTDAIDRRLAKCQVPLDTFDYHSFPAAFWDVYGKNGRPIQATVSGMGAQLLGRMLGLNETQTGVLGILYRYCAEYNYKLETIADLKEMLIRMGNNTEAFTLKYGNVSVASVGSIQRAVAMLEDEGGSVFFGQQEFNVLDWMLQDENGRGMINILSADELFTHPLMYSTFLLWMLTRLYEALPERGDADKPLIVFFFDEAHLLFDDCSRTLMSKIEQVVRLIRSKGVGVYFITQSPADIPMSILGQLGNRVQHALRAYTPLDQKAVKVAAQTFRTNQDFDTEEAITALKTGEALVSFLDEEGAPGVVERVTILPPQSMLGALSEAERAWVGRGLPLEEMNAETETVPAASENEPAAPAMPENEQAAPAEETEPSASAPAEPDLLQEQEQILAELQQTQASENPFPETEPPAWPEAPNPFAEQEPASGPAAIPTLDIPVINVMPEFGQEVPVLEIPVSSTTPESVQEENTDVKKMAQTFKKFDPVTGQYVEQEIPEMTQIPAAPAPVPAPDPVPTIQVQPAAPAPVAQQPVVQQPVLQQMPVMVLDPTTGQYVQQMMLMQQDPATGNWMAVQQAPVTAAPAAPAAPVDPIALAEQQKAAAAAKKEAEKAALQAAKDAEKAEREAARAAKEQEAAERRARNDALREEAAERARRNDSVAGRIKNTAISTATRQVTSSLTRGLSKALSDLFGGKRK